MSDGPPPKMLRLKLRDEPHPRTFHEPLDDSDTSRYSWWFIQDGVLHILTSRSTRRRSCFPLVNVDWYEAEI